MTINAYGVIDGHGNAGTIVALDPQPASPDLIEIETVWYGNGHAEVNGFESVELVWTALSYAEVTTLMTAFGVSATVASNEVSVCVRRYGSSDWVNFNATANYLRGERREQYGGVSNFRIVLNQLEAI